MRSIKINSELKLKPKIQQGLTLTLALRQALSILEMPLPELAQWLQSQIEQNPALQFSEEEPDLEWPKESFHHFQLSSMEELASPPPSLHDYLLQQTREALTSPHDLAYMEFLIGHLDAKGFLDSFPADPHFVRLLQSLEPAGIGATSLQECFLLQLERLQQQDSLAYQLIQQHYDDFLHQHKDSLCQKLSCTLQELEEALQTLLSSLTLNPAASFQTSTPPIQIPDVFIEPSDTGWTIRLNEALLPPFSLNLSPELAPFESSARWIQKILSRRQSIITRITEVILATQADFFHGITSDLNPLSFKQVARKLSLHASTLSRAVKEKYLSCPQGIFPLRYFFPHPTSTHTISHHTAKERIKELISRENKQKPLSDEELKAALHTHGIPCARRTVAKYRQRLKIPPAAQRRQ